MREECLKIFTSICSVIESYFIVISFNRLQYTPHTLVPSLNLPFFIGLSLPIIFCYFISSFNVLASFSFNSIYMSVRSFWRYYLLLSLPLASLTSNLYKSSILTKLHLQPFLRRLQYQNYRLMVFIEQKLSISNPL